MFKGATTVLQTLQNNGVKIPAITGILGSVVAHGSWSALNGGSE